jgi:hypothetical protein
MLAISSRPRTQRMAGRRICQDVAQLAQPVVLAAKARKPSAFRAAGPVRPMTRTDSRLAQPGGNRVERRRENTR